MSVAARSGRARRGRVLIVGDVPDANRLAQQFRNPPLLVRTLFDAIGEVTVASSSEPISTVVFSDRSLNGRGIEALRKLDPSVQLVLVTGDALNAARSTGNGVDECLTAPLRPEDVARVFAGDLIESEPAATSPMDDVAVQPTARQPAAREPVELIEPEVADEPPMMPPVEAPRATSTEEESPTPVVETLRQSSPPVFLDAEPEPEPVPEGPANVPATMLGDTDLVEAVLSGKGVRELALKIIVQQTGWHDIQLIDAPKQFAATKQAVVEVLFSGDSHGWLISASAGEAQLVPWADWLGRWLALDREHQLYRTLTYKDNLTEAWNRRYFDEFLAQTLSAAGTVRRPITLMVFDIDDFKRFNDEFGHEAGDQILCETVRLLTSVIRHGDRVCRIGGDEFGVIFADAEGPRRAGSTHPESIESIAKRFQDRVCAMQFPKLGKDAPGTLSISAGLATFPWDGHDAASLLRRADQRALESKRGGKNAITFGPGASCRPS